MPAGGALNFKNLPHKQSQNARYEQQPMNMRANFTKETEYIVSTGDNSVKNSKQQQRLANRHSGVAKTVASKSNKDRLQPKQIMQKKNSD